MEQNDKEQLHYLDHFNSDIHATLMRTGEADEAEFADFSDASALVNIAVSCAADEPNFAELDTAWFVEWLKSGKIIISRKSGKIIGFCCVGRYADIVWIRSLAVLLE